MSDDLVTALFGLGGVVVGSGTTFGTQWIAHRYDRRMERNRQLNEYCANVMTAVTAMRQSGISYAGYRLAYPGSTQALDANARYMGAIATAVQARHELDLFGEAELGKVADLAISKTMSWATEVIYNGAESKAVGQKSAEAFAALTAFVAVARAAMKKKGCLWCKTGQRPTPGA